MQSTVKIIPAFYRIAPADFQLFKKLLGAKNSWPKEAIKNIKTAKY
jgi:hypothetical protein